MISLSVQSSGISLVNIGLALAGWRNSCFLLKPSPLKVCIWTASVTCRTSGLENVPVCCMLNSTTLDPCTFLQCAHMQDESDLSLRSSRCSLPREYMLRAVSPLYSAIIPRASHSRHLILYVTQLLWQSPPSSCLHGKQSGLPHCPVGHGLERCKRDLIEAPPVSEIVRGAA